MHAEKERERAREQRRDRVRSVAKTDGILPRIDIYPDAHGRALLCSVYKGADFPLSGSHVQIFIASGAHPT